jgi:rhamnose utilization protein RhaD (predicted bifunctional aldolase and dehydrogenase)
VLFHRVKWGDVMRVVRLTFIVIFLGFLSSCGNRNKAQIEKLVDDLLNEYNTMVKAIESADKTTLFASMDRLIALHQQGKIMQGSKEDAGPVFEKAQGKFKELAERTSKALKAAKTNGKFTPAELQRIAEKFKELDRAL